MNATTRIRYAIVGDCPLDSLREVAYAENSERRLLGVTDAKQAINSGWHKRLGAVCIATEIGQRAPLARLFLERGIHVFCEYPATFDETIWKTLTDYANQEGLILRFASSSPLLWALEHAGADFLHNAVVHIQHRSMSLNMKEARDLGMKTLTCDLDTVLTFSMGTILDFWSKEPTGIQSCLGSEKNKYAARYACFGDSGLDDGYLVWIRLDNGWTVCLEAGFSDLKESSTLLTHNDIGKCRYDLKTGICQRLILKNTMDGNDVFRSSQEVCNYSLSHHVDAFFQAVKVYPLSTLVAKGRVLAHGTWATIQKLYVPTP